jgi:flagellar hook-basal body complex protein FliE
MSIAPANASASIDLPRIAPVQTETSSSKQVDLGEQFDNVLRQARDAEQASTRATERFASGDSDIGIHEVIIASEKASIAVRYVTTLKNKALDAYRDLMNTQV